MTDFNNGSASGSSEIHNSHNHSASWHGGSVWNQGWARELPPMHALCVVLLVGASSRPPVCVRVIKPDRARGCLLGAVVV